MRDDRAVNDPRSMAYDCDGDSDDDDDDDDEDDEEEEAEEEVKIRSDIGATGVWTL